MTIELWSADRRYGLRLEDAMLARLTDEAHIAGKVETGGILVGRYSSMLDCAVVTEVVPPPADSERGRTWFVRGVRGLTTLLRDRWRTSRLSYLGEWHFHPGARPHKSDTDTKEIQRLAATASARCPAPILLIVGGSMPTLSFAAWVAPIGHEPIELTRD